MELIERIDPNYSTELEDLDENDDQEWDNLKKQQKKSGAFIGRILGLFIAGFFYALSFLPMNESDKIMKYVLIGSALFFLAVVLLSFYKGKD